MFNTLLQFLGFPSTEGSSTESNTSVKQPNIQEPTPTDLPKSQTQRQHVRCNAHDYTISK